MSPHCVSGAFHVPNTPYVSNPPNPHLVESSLAISQPDSTIAPTPFDSNSSQCDSYPDVPLPLVLDSVVPPSPPSIDHSLPISSSSLLALRRSTRPHTHMLSSLIILVKQLVPSLLLVCLMTFQRLLVTHILDLSLHPLSWLLVLSHQNLFHFLRQLSFLSGELPWTRKLKLWSSIILGH